MLFWVMDDQFLSNLLPIFKMSFFIPLFGDGSKKFQPVLIDDVSRISYSKTIEERQQLDKQLFELGRSRYFYLYRDFYNLISDAMNKKRVLGPCHQCLL